MSSRGRWSLRIGAAIPVVLALLLSPSAAFATGAPLIEEESVSGITSTNATLKARINPNGFRAHYQFQIVTDPDEYASEILCPEPPRGLSLCIGEYAEGPLSIGFIFKEVTTVSRDLSSEGVTLQPGTTYHYRVLAARAIPSEDTIEWITPIFYGADQTFTTPEEEPTGPTNLRTLNIAKTANGPGGLGSVSSKPKGIKCGINCESAVASMYENSSVELTAKPGTHSAFSEWKGGDCEGSHSLTCTVTMDTAESIEAVFTSLPAQSEKTITPTEALTLSKGEGTGQGTVKGSGIACEAQCTETVVLYQGSNPPKAAKIVTLTATPAFGSEFTGWSGSGCSGIGSCVVTMSAAENVTATFTAKPNGTLSIEKTLNSGTVISKAKGIKCATACISQSASMPQGESILLTAMPVSGMTFSKWEGGDCQGIVLPTCTVVMDSSEPIKALFTGTPKAVTPEEKLTLTKAGSGFGTVKGSGLACEALCTSATSVYKGPTNYPAKTVTLEAASAPGSKPVQWGGCDTVAEGKCIVAMTAVKAVTATFDELE
jgi:Divergent InlB B-repeat domain